MLALLLLLWPSKAEAHVQWFVQGPTIVTENFTATEWLIALGMLSLLLGILAVLTRRDHSLWQRVRLPQSLRQWVPPIALGVGALFSVVAYHRELDLVYGGLIGYALLRRSLPNGALTVLAAGIGLAFTQAALAEKLLYPGYAATFLQDYNWNVFYHLGLTFFTDRWFILQAGVVEAGLGLALALGLAPRLTITLLAMVCLITAYLLGTEELMGHTPILMAFVIYLIETTHRSAWSLLNLRKRTEPAKM